MTHPAPQSAQANDVPLSRTQQERALLAALAGGSERLVEQIRFLLELSAQAPARPAAVVLPRRPLTTAEARVTALTNMAEYLSEAQIIGLYEQAQAVEDLETRLLSTVKLALMLPPQYFQAVVRTVGDAAEQITAPDARARVLFQLAPLLTLVHDEPAAPPILLEIVALAQAVNHTESRIRSLLALVPHLPHSMRVRVLHRIVDEIDKLHNDAQRSTALCALSSYLAPEIEARALRSAESLQLPAERARAFTALARHLPLALQPNLRRSALNAIGSIADEEERASALIGFAPHLEYVTNTDQFPRLLEQALGIAISIKRRHLRARVLVALAPHLTLDLQGEALAAVHSLSSERERAMLLAQLAPTLPPNMLVASLAVAHSMEEQDARVHALTVLAHYVPPSARERTLLDALNAANHLTNRYERVNALIALADALPPDLYNRAYEAALEAARLIDNENAKARALSLLAPEMPARLSASALEAARQLSNPEQRLTALASILRVLPERERLAHTDELLAAVAELPFEYKRARALGEIVDLLPAADRLKALASARLLEDPVDRANALTMLVPHLPPDQRRSVIIECWRLIKNIENGYDAATTLSALAPLLPQSAANDLARSAGMIIGSIMDEYDQASAITILAPLLAAQQIQPDTDALPDKHTALEKGLHAALETADPAVRLQLLAQGAQLWVDITDEDQAYRLWQNVLQHLAAHPLPDTLLAVGALIPVIRYLAGNKGVNQITQLLNDFNGFPVADSA
jgi:hypothetical protein